MGLVVRSRFHCQCHITENSELVSLKFYRMDEYDRGMDPEVKRYFKRIINSFGIASLWLLTVSTAGLFFKLAIVKDGIRWYNLVYYFLFLTTFILLLIYLFKTWRKNPAP